MDKQTQGNQYRNVDDRGVEPQKPVGGGQKKGVNPADRSSGGKQGGAQIDR